MRMMMKERGLKKQPGYRLTVGLRLGLGNQMHTYIAADLSHPQFEALCSVVTDLGNKMRTNMTTEAVGYEFLAI